MNQVTLVLPYPISANRYWATRTIKNKATGKPMALTYVTTEAKQYKSDVGWIAKQAGIAKPVAGRMQVHIQLYPNRPQDWQTRVRKLGPNWDDTVQCIDLDNAQKVLLDALKGVAIEDDKWVREISARRMEPDEKGARLVVTITPIRELSLLDYAEKI